MVIVPPVAVLLPVDYHLGRLACTLGQPGGPDASRIS